jgi:hypothetical protein
MSTWYQLLGDSKSDIVGKEVVALQDKFFDHGTVLSQEIDYFHREFEVRTGHNITPTRPTLQGDIFVDIDTVGCRVVEVIRTLRA